MDKHTKKECLALIVEKKLPYTIKRIAQVDRLMPTTRDNDGRCASTPIFSWIRLFVTLSEMKSSTK